MKNGPYELVLAPDNYPGKRYRGKYCYEHHLVYWRTHCILPGPGEVVHHKDENKRNNDPANLELKAMSEHSAEHSRERWAAVERPTVHGTTHAYQKRGCRCAPCRRANADYNNEYRWRTGKRRRRSGVAQGVEQLPVKEKDTGSNPVT